MTIPATGMVSAIIAAFARRPVFGYLPLVLALIAVGFLSFGLWVHHMFVTGLPQLGASFFTASSMLIAVPNGVQIFCWLATLWDGRTELKTPLLYVLRNDLDLHGPRFGCGLGQCGACTVIIKGEAVRSCIRPVSTVAGAEITTLEGLAQNGKLHPLQQAWIDEQVPACGFCQNGQIMTAKALLDKNPTPTDAQIRQGMANTLCRCMTYYRIQSAIKRASKTIASARAESEVIA